MSTLKKMLLIGSWLGVSGLSFPSYAVPVVPQLIPCALTDVTFRAKNADQCVGPTLGNDSNGVSKDIIGTQFGGVWSNLLKDNVGTVGDGTGTYNGVFFSLDPVSGKKGDWSLHWTDNNSTLLPMSLDLAVVIKASNRFDSYLFEDIVFADSPNFGKGRWNVTFLNNGGKIADLSHLSLYVRGNPGSSPNFVIAPETLSLVGVGLFGIAMARRRAVEMARPNMNVQRKA